MAKFRKKPIIVEAEQFIGCFTPEGVPLPPDRMPPGIHPPSVREEAAEPYVITAHGQRTVVKPGDWIIAEPDGRGYYPCKPDIFEATYEQVE